MGPAALNARTCPNQSAALSLPGRFAFRIGATDAEFLEKEFTPTLTAEDLTNLPNRSIYLKLMIDGKISPPFSG